MWFKWLPWRYVVSRLAKSHGFIDPVTVLSKLHQFAQPSEVTEPIELLRAGVVFHARGLLNTRTIQHNLDWVWPFWIEQQFDPENISFIPRAFSITHVNLTHRNWTAVGLPNCDQFPIVDPRGLVTPLFDGWSLDTWLMSDEGQSLFPSRAREAEQRLECDANLVVRTHVENQIGRLDSHVQVEMEDDRPTCRIRTTAASKQPGWLAIALRPANPEGVSFIHEVEMIDAPSHWRVERDGRVFFDRSPERVLMSCYRDGDVAVQIADGAPRKHQTCDIGLCTAVALYRMESGDVPNTVSISVPLTQGDDSPPMSAMTSIAIPHAATKSATTPGDWSSGFDQRCRIQTPDDRVDELFHQATYTLALHAPGEVFPGPYTYKRFWFRDAAFILNALLATLQFDRVERAIARFPKLQTPLGYFHSQDGEWDSNGAAIWSLDRYRRCTGRALSDELMASVKKGARWIEKKRLSDTLDKPHAGLMPAGFSAEHLGPNDYYYWDDFWSAGGLKAAAAIARANSLSSEADEWEAESDSILRAVDRSVQQSSGRRDRPGLPASPYRRLDSGAIGSLAISYPLGLCKPDDPRLMDTVEFLLEHCMVRGGFFQDMIHSGINAYLTLHIAQVLMRSGLDHKQQYIRLLEAVRDLASPTGQWPEAIHPHTGGGCMGDGQHVWAAAEWVLMVRNLFVREEGNTLIVAGGIPRSWLETGSTLEFGPTATAFGTIAIRIEPSSDGYRVRWTADWREPPATLSVALPTCDIATVDPEQLSVEICPANAAYSSGG